MNSRFLAETFIEYFCKADVNGIDSLLASNFRFTGPLFEFSTKRAYIESLQGSLEADPDATILGVVGGGAEAAAFYRYKGNTIGQWFRCDEGKIHETLVVFDARQVSDPPIQQ